MMHRYRAKRDTETAPRATTTETVGPGSYDVEHNKRWINKPYAPFSSTAERGLNKGSSSTPGPGSYTVHTTAAVQRDRAGKIGRQPRFKTERLDDIPGPGSYAPPDSWGRPRARTLPQASGRRINWVRSNTAPSIPRRDQSFGYEESPDGELIAQQPPPVRPASAEAVPYVFRQGIGADARGTNFGASRAKRAALDRARENIPGPGSYNVRGSMTSPENTGSGNMFIKQTPMKHRPSPSFASTVPRNLAAASSGRRNAAPGPGSYTLPDTFRKQRELPRDLQCFGSTSNRLFDDERAVWEASNAPGPGQYQDGLSTTLKLGGKFNASPAAGFGSAQRFVAKTTDDGPGPGVYVDNGTSQRAASNRNSGARHGILSLAAPRFQSQRVSKCPGPGQYAVKQVAIDPSKTGGAASAFVSKTDRQRGVPGTASGRDIPAPGSYNVEHAWRAVTDQGSLRTRRARVMVSSSPRTLNTVSKDALMTPGPGSYNNTVILQDLGRRGGKFVSKGDRFTGADHCADSPGPGSYETGQPSLVKRSFNITIGDWGY